MRKPLRLLVAAASAGGVLAGALLAAEVALRKAGGDLRDDGFPRGMFVNDPARGYSLAPGTRASVQRVHRFDLSVNESGYRDRSWRAAQSGRRLLMVGSSALFGFGVQAEERLSERLEHHLSGSRRVLNAGVYGYGAPQARATIGKECAALSPELVVYVHEYKLTRHDFLAEQGRHVVDGDLVNRLAPTAPAPAAATAAAVPPGDSLWNFRRLRAWLWRRGWHPVQLAEALLGTDRLPSSYVERRYVLTKPGGEFPPDGPARVAREVGAMARISRQCGADFIAVILPGPYEHRYAYEPASSAIVSLLEGKVRVADLRRLLRDRPALMLEGLDYFDAEALDAFGVALAGELR